MAEKIYVCRDTDGVLHKGKDLTEAYLEAEFNGYVSDGVNSITMFEATAVEVELKILPKEKHKDVATKPKKKASK